MLVNIDDFRHPPAKLQDCFRLASCSLPGMDAEHGTNAGKVTDNVKLLLCLLLLIFRDSVRESGSFKQAEVQVKAWIICVTEPVRLHDLG